MSGICGIVRFDGGPASREAVLAMAHEAAYRGPDGIHVWSDGAAALGNLAVNLGAAGANADGPLDGGRGRFVVTADARIDNRRELIGALGVRGHLDGPDPSDAELVLAAYRQWGTDCPARLVGDFAFVIWDARERRVFACRDPMAMRPLYHRHERDRWIFGSEVKQVLAAPDVPVRPSSEAVTAHLVTYFDAGGATFYDGIEQLRPGHALLVDAGGSREWRYWDLDPGAVVEYADERDYVEHFLELFVEAVRCRLPGAKPAGIFLSGGLDSGSIASTAAAIDRVADRHAPLHAFSWAFESLVQCDERAISSIITDHYGLDVTAVSAEAHHPLSGFPAHGPDRDEPFLGHYQPLIETALAEARRRGMGAVFFGARGDLTMGGDIFDYAGMLRRGEWGALVGDLAAHRRATGSALRDLVGWYLLEPLWAEHGHHRAEARMGRALHRPEGMGLIPEWVAYDTVRDAGILDAAAARPPASPFRGARRERYEAVASPLNQRAMAWLERTLARFGLAFVDPWSDLRLVAFSVAVPQRVLNGAGHRKRLAREAMRGIMPEGARRSARKIVPSPLLERALKDWAKPVVLRLLDEPRAASYGYLDGAKLRAYYEAYASGTRAELDPRFWYALTLEMWLRRHWE